MAKKKTTYVIETQADNAPIERFIVSLSKMSSEGEKTHSTISKLFGKEGFFATEQIEKVVEYAKKVFELGEAFVEAAVKQAEFKEISISTLDVMLDSAEAAEREFGALKDIARGSAMTKQEVMAQYTELFSFTEKYGAKATENVIAAGSDIQKLLGSHAQETFVNVIHDIEAMGTFNTRMVRQLKEVGVATPEKVYESLAEQLHTTSKGAQSLIKAGKVSQEMAIQTLLDLVNKNINKGEGLGFYGAEKSAKNVDNQLKNVKESFLSIFEDVDTGGIATALKKLAADFDPGTAAGEHMRVVVTRAFNDITKVIEYAAEHMDGWISKAEKFLGFAERAVGFIESHPLLSATLLGAAAGGVVGGGLGAIVGAAGGAGAVIGGQLGNAAYDQDVARQQSIDTARFNVLNAANAAIKPTDIQPEIITENYFKTGTHAAEGFNKGFSENLDIDALVDDHVIDAIDKKLGINSPSTVLFKRGQFSAQGFNLGWDNEEDIGGRIDVSVGSRIQNNSSMSAPMHIDSVVFQLPAGINNPQDYEAAATSALAKWHETIQRKHQLAGY